MADYTELKRLAGAATPGPWVPDGECANESGHVLYAYIAHAEGGRIGEAFANCLVKTDEQCRANAAFMAVANPQAVLSLIVEFENYRCATRACLSGRALSLIEENVRLVVENKQLRESLHALVHVSDATGWENHTCGEIAKARRILGIEEKANG
ncbi:hypothetical protein D3C78_411750 [compost metagenome]